MFRHHTNQPFCRSIVCAVLLSAFASSGVFAQQQSAARQAPVPKQPSPELWKLLTEWSEKSRTIKNLSGKHQRHSYDSTFGIEKISKGTFGYEAPDKGRIDIEPIKVTPEMVAARAQPGAQVETIKQGPHAGKPFKLQADDKERWVCDGTKVFDIDDENKVARVGFLPPQVRGENIMNSPLPFLFGLPPQQAVQRFNMEIEQDWRPKHPFVQLKAVPRTQEDAKNWSRAHVILSTKTYLPTKIRLYDTAETSYTTYQFESMKVNGMARWLGAVFGNNPFEPNLDGYQVQVVRTADQNVADQQQAPQVQPNAAVTPGLVPNVYGQSHGTAKAMLIQAGVPEGNIKNLNAGPAPEKKWTYRVVQQVPAAKTRIDAGTEVQLHIYDEAKVGANAARPQGSRVAGARN